MGASSVLSLVGDESLLLSAIFWIEGKKQKPKQKSHKHTHGLDTRRKKKQTKNEKHLDRLIGKFHCTNGINDIGAYGTHGLHSPDSQCKCVDFH